MSLGRHQATYSRKSPERALWNISWLLRKTRSQLLYCSLIPILTYHGSQGSLALCNRYEDIHCGSQSTGLFPAILVKCNGSDTRDFIGFMVCELVITQRLRSANRNYSARSVSSDCTDLDSWLDSWPINIYQVHNAGSN